MCFNQQSKEGLVLIKLKHLTDYISHPSWTCFPFVALTCLYICHNVCLYMQKLSLFIFLGWTDLQRTLQNVSMSFNISDIRGSIGDYRLLTTAELRILIKTTAILVEQRVELYQGLGTSARYLASRFITNKWKDKWLSFDVTETLQKWLEGNGELKQALCNYLLRSRLSICWGQLMCNLLQFPEDSYLHR